MALAQNVYAGTITSSPGRTPHSVAARLSALVALATAKACFAPVKAAKSFWNCSCLAPWVCPCTLRIASTTTAISASVYGRWRAGIDTRKPSTAPRPEASPFITLPAMIVFLLFVHDACGPLRSLSTW